jgi:hypothetical protein
MNKIKLMRYAPRAPKNCTAFVTARANGPRLSSSGTERAGKVRAEPVRMEGDVAVISAAQQIFEGHAVSRSLQGK